jgi:hypothetical protein
VRTPLERRGAEAVDLGGRLGGEVAPPRVLAAPEQGLGPIQPRPGGKRRRPHPLYSAIPGAVVSRELNREDHRA